MAPSFGVPTMWWDRPNEDAAKASSTASGGGSAATTAAGQEPTREGRPTLPLSATPPGLSLMPEAGVGADGRVASGSFIVDGTGMLLAFDRNMERMTGWNAFEIVGQPKDLGLYEAPDENGQRRYHAMPLYEGRLSRIAQSTTTTLMINRKDGTKLEVEALVSPLGVAGNRFVVEVQRVLARVQGPLKPAAAEGYDSVTGLPGIDLFREKLKESFAATRHAGRPLAVLLVDVDRTAGVTQPGTQVLSNDVIRRIAGILQASVRMSDPIGRTAQGQFAMVLEGTGRGDARAVGGRMRAMVERFSLGTTPGGADVKATVSIGVACYPADGDSPGELMRRADEALREAHRLGRNRVWCYVRRPRVNCYTEIYFDGPEGQMLGMSHDLSNSGLFVETSDQLPDGMRLGLRFTLPDVNEEVHVVGRVTRRVTAGGVEASSISGLGIEFERFSDSDRWRLEQFLHTATTSQPSTD